MKTRPTLAQACAQYPHRYTMDHVPTWARKPCGNGKFYAPQFASDREWYEHTLFNGEHELARAANWCYTTESTWPLGQWLDVPYRGKS